MKKYIIIAALSSCLITYTKTKKQIPTNHEGISVDFYDVQFLRNSPVVQKILEHLGFIEVNVKTKDKLIINTIMLDQSENKDIQATIVSCPGFFPGRKEGMTTLYAMLEQEPYNFIFIDSRGHGKSDGELLTINGIKNYGKRQYLDVVATVQYIARYNKRHNIRKDIIIHGLCAGAYHAIKAVAYLQKHDPTTYDCIKGIVVDSGWPSLAEVAETVVMAEAAARCKNYNLSFLQNYAQQMILQFYRFFFKDAHAQQKSIVAPLAKIDKPIFFIHAKDDDFVPIDAVYPLITTAQQPTCWFVDDSSHVNNHLKHKESYAQQLKIFFTSIL